MLDRGSCDTGCGTWTVEHEYEDDLIAIVHVIAGSWICPSVSSSAACACTTAMDSPRSMSTVAADTGNSNG